MNATTTQTTCNCTDCPGQQCTCGCQNLPMQQTAQNAACACGPQCQCGPACACQRG
jgi:hypothetical protein